MTGKAFASHWFMLAIYCLALTNCAAQYLNWWPVWLSALIALPLVVARLRAGRDFFAASKVEPLIAVFIASALVSLWAAYDADEAFKKFSLIISSVLLFYSIALQPGRNRLSILASLALVGGIISVFFLLSYDWINMPADIRVVNTIGNAWMKIRPINLTRATSDDWVGGALAVMVPMQFALFKAGQRQKSWGWAFAGVLGLAASAAGLFFTGSRAAWLALLLAIVVWLGLQQVPAMKRPPGVVFFSVVLVSIFFVAGLAGWFFEDLLLHTGWENVFSSFASVDSRLDLYRRAIQLAKDFILFGGGLGSFSGLYSRYVLDIPYLFTSYSHNLYLDLAVEQGAIGLIPYLLVLSISLAKILHCSLRLDLSPAQRAICLGVFASLVVFVAHSLFEDAFFVAWGMAGLFFLPGMVDLAIVGVSFRTENTAEEVNQTRHKTRPIWYKKREIVPGIFALVVLGIYLAREPLASLGYANLGAVRMAQVELAGWPERAISNYEPLPALAEAREYLQLALRYNPTNSTAHHRLGLMAMRNFDFEAAIEELKQAYAANPHHRGIQKTLGYSYIWAGRLAEAEEMLTGIPEAGYEISTYAWWWDTQGRPDLSWQASQFVLKIGYSSE